VPPQCGCRLLFFRVLHEQLQAGVRLLEPLPLGGELRAGLRVVAGQGAEQGVVLALQRAGERRGQVNRLLALLAAADGKEQWRTKIGAVGKDGPPSYPGPRSTPTLDGDRIYVLGSDGDLVCIEKAKGEVQWKQNLKSDLAGKPGQ
jgi:outer membrane protein assembly factor BamB